MTRPDHDPAIRTAHQRLRFRDGCAHLPRARRERDGREHGAVRRRPPPARAGRDGHRPAEAQGRGRGARVPRGRALGGGRRGRRALVRRSRGQPRGGRAGRAVRGAGPVQLPAPPAGGARSGPMPGSPTGRPSRAPSCCCRARATRSPGSTCSARRCRCCATRSWSRTRASGTRSSRSSTTRWTAWRPSWERRSGARGLAGSPIGRVGWDDPPGADTVRPCPAARPPPECPYLRPPSHALRSGPSCRSTRPAASSR